MSDNQTPNNAKKPRQNTIRPMNQPLQNPPAPQEEPGSRLAGLFGGGKRPVQYTSILKCLDAIGLPQRFMDVMLGDEPVQCLVVPMQDLIFKEWAHMTQNALPPGEEQ